MHAMSAATTPQAASVSRPERPGIPPGRELTEYTGRRTAGRPEVLIASPFREDRRFFRSVFETMQWITHEASRCREACDFLRTHRPNVIICDWELPDGSWREILSEIAPLPTPPSLLVVSVVEDCRWAEVLNLGAYDLLAKPLDRTEILRIGGLAYLHSTQTGDEKQSATAAAH